MKKNTASSRRDHMGLRIEILDELLGGIKKRNYEELLDVLNEKLTEQGDRPVSLRTLQYDIANLAERKEAPIHRPDKKDVRVYYTEKFSLKTIPIDPEEVAILRNAVAILKKAANIHITKEVDEIISRLENRIHTNVADSNTMIAFEEHTEAGGKEYFEDLFNAIKEKSTIKLTYQPFGKEEREWLVHPYMLKEYRNRWFLIGRIGDSQKLSNIRLDSIKGKIKNTKEPFIENNLFDTETYFNNVIGVTIPAEQEPLAIIIKVAASSADYIRTKPIHKSQVITKENKDGSMRLELNLFNNYELKSTLMSYGPAVEVLKPDSLRNEMKTLYEDGVLKYK